MTKSEKVALINATILNERNDLARKSGAEAYLNPQGNIRYRHSLKGYAQRATFSEILGLLHGIDIRALREAI